MTEIAVAIITGIFTLFGVIITVLYGNNKTQKSIKSQTDLTIYRIDLLEKKVENQAVFAEKIPLIEAKLRDHTGRIDHLERYHEERIN